VASKKTWMNGYPVGDARMVVGSPNVKQKVMVMMNPSVPLMAAEVIMARGSTREASLISSAICTAESAPSKV
jgi:hypothetical protein